VIGMRCCRIVLNKLDWSTQLFRKSNKYTFKKRDSNDSEMKNGDPILVLISVSKCPPLFCDIYVTVPYHAFRKDYTFVAVVSNGAIRTKSNFDVSFK